MSKELTPTEPLGKEEQPVESATGTPSIQNADSHKNQYYRLFEKSFEASRIDLLSNELRVKETGGDSHWKCPFNRETLHTLETLAYEADLKPAMVKRYLNRYAKELRQSSGSELLIDIPTWDGVDRISHLASRLHSPEFSSAQVEEIIKEWLAKVFMRLENPKVDNRCLVLAGNQGIGKDVFIKALTCGFNQFVIPFQYQAQQKDMLHALHGGVVVHIEEFDHISEKLSPAFLKMLITTPTTCFREAYGKSQQTRYARWSLISSCNHQSFLADHTGNRRFIIIPVDAIDGIRRSDGELLAYPEGLINFPTDEGLNILAQAKSLALQRYTASASTNLMIDNIVKRLTPIDPEKDFIEDILRYTVAVIGSCRLVKSYHFLPDSTHRSQIMQAARLHGLKLSWPGVKKVLERYGINSSIRTKSERGIGIPPELIEDYLAQNTSLDPNYPLGNGIHINGNGAKQNT